MIKCVCMHAVAFCAPCPQIRAQYFVALTTHQAVCQMQALISDLHTAHHPATAPDLPRTDPLGWAKQLLPLALATDAWRYLGQSVRAGWQAVRGGREAMQRVFGTDLVVAVVKYWAVLTVMLVVILVLLTKLPRNAFSTPPIFAYLTAAAVMRPKVHANTHTHTRAHTHTHNAIQGAMHIYPQAYRPMTGHCTDSRTASYICTVVYLRCYTG